MASVLSRRLGKRSLLGALVHTPSPSGDGMLIPGVIQAFRLDPRSSTSLYTVSFEDGQFKEYSEDNIIGPGFKSLSRFKLYPGQKVYLTHSGRECAGLVEQHNHVDNEVLIYVEELGLRSLRRIEDVRLGESRKSLRLRELEREHTRVTTNPSEPKRNHCSDSINVPTRVSGTVDMDEIMAAMVLTSLSSNPLVNSPLDTRPMTVLGDSGNDSGSGNSINWSSCWSSNSSSPSPPQLTPELGTAQADDAHPLLFEEPAPRKRKNSMKLLYRCMWPSCQKLLSSTVGIRRHIRTVHLRRSDSDHSDGEEDFYYTEIRVNADKASEILYSRRCVSPPAVLQCQKIPAGPKEEASEFQVSDTLSQSAPSCLWQVCVDHTYQVSPEYGCAFTFGDCSVQPQVALFKPHIVFASMPQALSRGKKVRGEAKKCRKVYGVENRSQWCTACKWKKACQRFHD
ncbi:zinc finger protein 395-like isoform X2 [Heterodontus francisci]|uniref:zinc finger protein 395-like isoform X2 n=1 Tax=Heterodontus francisci TaxID=7792 RepID=UPI00355BB36B